MSGVGCRTIKHEDSQAKGPCAKHSIPMTWAIERWTGISFNFQPSIFNSQLGSTRNVVTPIRTRSPGRIVEELDFWPFTNVPLVLPRSVICRPSAEGATLACLLEAELSNPSRIPAASRPISTGPETGKRWPTSGPSTATSMNPRLGVCAEGADTTCVGCEVIGTCGKAI